MYEEMFEYVKEILSRSNGESANIGSFPFRKRSQHIWRVYKWAERLLEEGDFDSRVDRESLLTAALFHDVGYGAEPVDTTHGEISAIIFRHYAASHNIDPLKTEFIEYLIRNHSNKEYLHCKEIPLELVLLMEADQLDETGALSIVWDCMAEGAQAEQNFAKTYQHIRNYSYKAQSENPMRTRIARKYWFDKQELTSAFVRQLELDLFGNE